MKQKMIRLCMALCMVGMVLAGCGKQSTEKQDTTADSDAVEGASIDLITDWENKAEITLGEKIKIAGSGVELSDNVLHITEGGAYSISGESDDVSVLIDTEDDVKIILNGAVMASQKGPVIYGSRSNSLYVETAKGTENMLTDSSEYETDSEGNAEGKATLCSNDDLVLLGSGTLTVNGNFKHCIAGDDKVYFEGGSYVLKTDATDGVHVNELLCVDAGEFEIEAASDGMESETDLVINGGTISGSSDDEGIEAKGQLEVNGGTVELSVNDDGFNAGTSLCINDGAISVHATTGDALDSNGSLVINGGTVTAYGGSAPEGALDCDNAQIFINGGTLIAVGDANSEISTESEQISVLLGQYGKGNKISITTEDGAEVMSFTLEDAKANIVVSSEQFKSGETYKVLVDGEEERSFTADATVVAAGGSATSMGGGRDGNMQMPENGQIPRDEQMQMPQDGAMPAPQGGQNMDGNRPELPSEDTR